MKACAYCGAQGTQLEREHAIPRCLYPVDDGEPQQGRERLRQSE